MSSREAFRLAGLALVVGAVLSFVGTVLNSLLFTGNDPTPYAGNALFVPVNILSAVGAGVLLLGVPALYLSRPEGWGVLGLIGLVLVFATGLMFGIFFSLLSALLLPYLVQQAPATVKGNGPPSFFPFFILGTVFEVVGLLLMAVPIVRGFVAARWLGYVLLAAAVLGVVGFFLGGSNGPSNALIALIGNLPGLLLFVVLGWLGYLLWMARAPLRDRLTGR
jgi:hypothetical protein